MVNLCQKRSNNFYTLLVVVKHTRAATDFVMTSHRVEQNGLPNPARLGYQESPSLVAQLIKM